MNTDTIEATFEIVPADLGLDITAKNSLELAFQGFFATAAEWKTKAESITNPKEARSARLEMKALRVAVEKKHKEMKADSLLFGRAVDGAKNIFLAMATPIERQLDNIEKAEERRIAAIIDARRQEREETLEELGHVNQGINLGTLTDAEWEYYLQQAKDVFAVRLERERKAKEEAEAAAKKDAEEREAQRLENIRLREEAAKREAELKAEREAAARAAEAARIEREAIEAKAKAEREKAEAIAAEEQRKAQEIAAEAARKQAKAEAEAKAMRDAESKRIADEKAAAEAKAKADAAAAKKAAAAPDKSKLIEFAIEVRNMLIPTVKSDDANMVRDDIAAKLESFANWIEEQAATI